MNAIILAGGKSSRMFQSGEDQHKALLPIQNIPNIERIILMLHCCDITEIIVVAPYNNAHFDYLAQKYSCKVAHIHQKCANTLYTLKPFMKHFDDTFIIEGDVVLTKNIFTFFKDSTYYVIKYPYPEKDDWHPILNSDGEISSFRIGAANSPAIFGISFWAHNDCQHLISYLEHQLSLYNIDDPNVFWDDNILDIVDKVSIKTYEISPNAACEMNTCNEYKFAQNLCQNMMQGTFFFDNVTLHISAKSYFKINTSTKQSKNRHWLEQLLLFYGDNIPTDLSYTELFSPDEKVFIIKNEQNQEIAFFSLVQQKHYFLLRRIYIIPRYRRQQLGKNIVNYVYLFSKLNLKELRINVYDNDAEKFYKFLGFKEMFKTFHIEP